MSLSTTPPGSLCFDYSSLLFLQRASVEVRLPFRVGRPVFLYPFFIRTCCVAFASVLFFFFLEL
jgi:hypothetical protein